MDKRVQQVCLTYLQTWFQWLVMLLYFVLCVGAICAGNWFSGHELADVAPQPRGGRTEIVGRRQALDQASRDARTIFWTQDRTGPSVSISRPFPKLTALRIWGALKSGEELQVLRSMPNLESLTFSGNLPSNSLRYVAELPNLR